MANESQGFRIGNGPDPTTLVNAVAYPSAQGAPVDRLLSYANQSSDMQINALQGGDAATFGTANLQRQYSLDGGANWINDGAAVTAATPVAVTLNRNARYRWTVGGTGNITAARLFLA